ncbi:hypothetical protein JYU34_007474 [Plutella xylostella]|uniref:RGS domain-containing protein n=1 Tax=Plutella xylostella TaxID=51655 RepID=A0ABQ7QQL1_PLUXY|nr:hypothetical protein JYU34_007474 [Plutella xylostella]
MIKFWKSAAKGKSGFPVRPPENHSITNKTVSLETIHENEDLMDLFNKKSHLSLNLSDIINNKNSVKYFIQFMQSIDKIMIIKSWMELENFRVSVSKSKRSDMKKVQLISRTQSSFNLDCNSQKRCAEGNSPSLFFKKIGSESIITKSISKSDGSSSSCQNLSEHATTSEEYSDEHSITEKAVSLFKKYIALEASNSLDLPDNVRKVVISNICNPQGHINEDCFKPVIDLLFQQMETNFFNDFQKSPWYTKAQIDILTSGVLNLNDILHNEAILFYFTEYLEQESCCLLLEFLMAVMHYRDNLSMDNSNPQQAQEDAIIIYEKYFSLQALSPVGFTTDIRLNIESEICRDGGPVYTCFDVPYHIVFKTLSHYVKSFQDSEVYYKYLSEMINSVDQAWSHRRSQSDCSSEFSMSTQNTLLAMGDPVFHRKKRNHSVPDMTIDSNQLYNADSLWQRKKSDGLSLGRINSLGRFESKFEPDPDKKERSTLKKMVSRFVPTTTSKVDEEMAWQIAHMIVKDVTDLTMAPPENDRDTV